MSTRKPARLPAPLDIVEDRTPAQQAADGDLVAALVAPLLDPEPAPVTPLLVDRTKARDCIAQAVSASSQAHLAAMDPWTCTCPTEAEPERWCEHQYADSLLDLVAIGAPALQAMDRDAALQAANRLRGAIVNGGTVNPDVAMSVVDWVERLAGHED